MIRASTLLPDENIGLALRTALNGATANNVLGDWSCAHIALGDLLDVLKHEKLPSNFVRLGDKNYVTRNMDWVIDKFDFGNKLHTLALMYGFIVKYMNPAVYTPADYTSQMKRMGPAVDKQTTLAFLRRLPWQMKGGKTSTKGNTQTDVFVVMFTAFVIGIYNDSSPIGDHMDGHKNTLGEALTSKYGKLISLPPMQLISNISPYFKVLKASTWCCWRAWELSGAKDTGFKFTAKNGAG